MPAFPIPDRPAPGPAAAVTVFALAALLLAVPLTAAGQEAQGEWTDEEIDRLLKERPVERVTVDLVLLRITVESGKGRPVEGLGPEDFSVREDGVPQTMTVFGVSHGEPVQLAVLLDVSGSMRFADRFERAKRAVRRLRGSLGPDDRFALLGFAEGQVAELVRWDEDAERLDRVLDVLEAYGRTALTDAIAATPSLMDERDRGRKVIVLITDGVDNASRLSTWEAMSSARRTGVPIYPIAFVDRPAEMALETPYHPRNNVFLLRRYARETGGRLFLLDPSDGPDGVVDRIDRDLRLQYVVGYGSPGPPDGRFRRVEVTVSKRNARVRHRAGYYARLEEAP